MSDRFFIMLFSHATCAPRKIMVRRWVVHMLLAVSSLGLGTLVYLVCDYVAIRKMQVQYRVALEEKEHLRSEAKHVAAHLARAKVKLKKLDDHLAMLKELTDLSVDSISEQAGIGPLDAEEEMIQNANQFVGGDPAVGALGIAYDDFVFRPLMEKIGEVQTITEAQNGALKMLLLNLQRKRHLVFSVPVGKPVEGWITSSYGHRISPFTGQRGMHYGIDIAARVGTPVRAPADGVVIFAGTKSGFGRFLMIAHDHGIVTKYGHNSELFVTTGEQVKRGDPIAAVGSTGRSTGPHLHYEIWVNGKPQNPKRFLLLADMPWTL